MLCYGCVSLSFSSLKGLKVELGDKSSFKTQGLKQTFWHFVLEALGLLKCFILHDKFKDACGTKRDTFLVSSLTGNPT